MRVTRYIQVQMLKLSITRDTANRLGFNPLQRFVHFTRKIWYLFLRSRTSGCLRKRRPKHGLPKRSSDHCPMLIQSYRSSTSSSNVPARVTTKVNQARAHSDLRLHRYASGHEVFFRLFDSGWSFPQDVMALLHASRPTTGFSMVPVNRPSPSSVYWILVSSLEVLRPWKCSPCRCHHGVVVIDVESSFFTPLSCTHTKPHLL